MNKQNFIELFDCEKKLWLSKQNTEKKYEDDVSEMLSDEEQNKAIFCSSVNATEIKSNQDELIGNGVKVKFAKLVFEDFTLDLDVVEKNGSILTFHSFFNLPSNEVKTFLEKGTSDSSLKSALAQMAFLTYVMQEKMGLVVTAKLSCINSMYVRDEELDLEKAFYTFDVTNQMPVLFNDVSEIIEKHKSINQEPKVMVGTQCKNPFDCPYKYVCWKNINERSIHNIPRISTNKRTELLEKGWDTIDKIQDLSMLTDNQKVVVKNILGNKVLKQPMKLMMFLSRLQYPIYHLDFEAVMPSLPLFEGTRAFDTIPTQYSLHIEQKNGTLEHKEFIEIDKKDPRWDLITSLLSNVGDKGSILVYNKAFEQGVLQSMIRWFPSLEKEITNLINRLVDLMVPFKDGDYFHPNMYFSYSLKYVLPALVPALSYEILNIKHGGQIMKIYNFLYNCKDEQLKQKIKKDLLDYCKQDTLAMVEILKVLRK
jgi:hypothetical protein